jgi:RNA methyltransferase, TrmH family
MLSKTKIKLIRSLDSKKFRNETGLFIAEGEKLVHELIDSHFNIEYIAGTEEWFETYTNKNLERCKEKEIVTEAELHKASFLKTPQQVLCLTRLPHYVLDLDGLMNKLVLVLDNVQDPGNLGTILRIADWFGIENIICSKDTADAFNPKVIQATMGAICRVKVFYEDLDGILTAIKKHGSPVYGTTLEGENIYSVPLTPNGFIMMGNESKGINPAWLPKLDKQLFIPFYPENKKRSESLNVAIATAIICSEFRRRMGVSA